jgi:hypothetical protein
MALFYKRFHPWRKINPMNVYNAPTVQEILTVNFVDEEASLNESDVEFVDENDMEDDTDSDDDATGGLQLEILEQLEMRQIFI